MGILDNFTATGPQQITFPIVMDPKGTWAPQNAQYVVVDNGSAAVILISDLSGKPFITVPAYQARSWALPGFTGVMFQQTNAAVLQPNDTLTIFIYSDQQNFQSTSYGPAAWGAGAVPASLVNVNPGDGFFAWQVQQLIAFLENGGVTGTLTVNGQVQSIGPNAALVSFDRDGLGGDYVALFLASGVITLYSGATGTAVLTSDESGDVKIPAGSLTVNGPTAILKGQVPSAGQPYGWLYVSGAGALHYLSPAGTDTQIAPN